MNTYLRSLTVALSLAPIAAFAEFHTLVPGSSLTIPTGEVGKVVSYASLGDDAQVIIDGVQVKAFDRNDPEFVPLILEGGTTISPVGSATVGSQQIDVNTVLTVETGPASSFDLNSVSMVMPADGAFTVPAGQYARIVSFASLQDVAQVMLNGFQVKVIDPATPRFEPLILEPGTVISPVGTIQDGAITFDVNTIVTLDLSSSPPPGFASVETLFPGDNFVVAGGDAKILSSASFQDTARLTVDGTEVKLLQGIEEAGDDVFLQTLAVPAGTALQAVQNTSGQVDSAINTVVSIGIRDTSNPGLRLIQAADGPVTVPADEIGRVIGFASLGDIAQVEIDSTPVKLYNKKAPGYRPMILDGGTTLSAIGTNGVNSIISLSLEDPNARGGSGPLVQGPQNTLQVNSNADFTVKLQGSDALSSFNDLHTINVTPGGAEAFNFYRVEISLDE